MTRLTKGLEVLDRGAATTKAHGKNVICIPKQSFGNFSLRTDLVNILLA